MRGLRFLVVMLLAACASAPRGEVGLEGTYRLERVNDERLPTAAGSETGVTLHAGTLALQPGRRYVLRMVAAVRDQPEQRTAEIAGSYRVWGDSLAMMPDPGAGAEEVHFLWTLRGADLRLHDEDGDEYLFRRQ